MKFFKKIFKLVYIAFFRIIHRNKIKNNYVINEFLSDYKNSKKINDIFTIFIAHKNGFLYSDWNIIKNEEKLNIKEYLTNFDYYRLHPYNGKYSHWIDDKLTLKYLCNGTKLEEFFPKYYAQILDNGTIIKLCDYKEKNSKTILDIDDILELLKKEKILAFKLMDGSIGKGFYKVEYKKDKYYLNEIEYSLKSFKEVFSKLKNYLIIEYLFPIKEFEKFSKKSLGSLRYLVGRIDGKLEFLKSFMRFGTNESNFVENFNCGGILCYINEEGSYNGGYVLKNGKSIFVAEHVDTKEPLKGNIPMWSKIQEVVREFDSLFPQLNYLGFDFALTSNNEIKILEINSLTSLDTIQLDESILKSKKYVEFLKQNKEENR